MHMKAAIRNLVGREVLDSRGNPTVEAELVTDSGKRACAMVPSGASTGSFEAVELRDGDGRYLGKGVRRAVSHIDGEIREALLGKSVLDQRGLDQLLRDIDGTENKGRLGANSILAVSFAAAKAAAMERGMELYQYMGEISGMGGRKLPIPMLNILNGGRHSENSIDFQEFMILPRGACCFHEGLRMAVEVYHHLKLLLTSEGYDTGVGDEGGFAPNLADTFQVFDILMGAVKKAGYEPGKDIVFAMDAAASELYSPDGGVYCFPGESRSLQAKGTETLTEDERTCLCAGMPDTKCLSLTRTTDEMIAYYEELLDRYPIVSIEDPLAEEDWDGWVKLTRRLGRRVMLVGDDLFVTNVKRLKKGIDLGAANAILIKPNQIGTVSETMDAVALAVEHGYQVIMSHRSGETEDNTIADLAVGMNTGYIKTGAPCRSERTAKYNRLLRIEDQIKEKDIEKTGKIC